MIPNKEGLERIGQELSDMMPGCPFVLIVFDMNNPAANKVVCNVNDVTAAVIIEVVNNKLNPPKGSL